MNPIAAAVAEAQARQEPPPPPPRLVSLDAFRGFVMLLMAAELLQLPHIATHFPDSAWWQQLAFHWEHVAWTGCSLHDLIQPAFSFMVGVALPFSLAARLRRGDGTGKLWVHALWRALLLVLLGVVLRSIGRPMTHWTFEDTLSQIGLGYPFLFALGFAGAGWRWGTLAVILFGYWAAFAVYPVPPADFDWEKWNGHAWFEGFRAHWNQNGNAAWAFDRWFLNLFPREHEFMGNGGGYSTLSFIPTLGTMILGLVAGQWLHDSHRAATAPTTEVLAKTPLSRGQVLLWLVMTGLLCLGLGWALDATGACPSVKKIWTPAWVLFSGGWCFLIMAAFHLVADVAGLRALFFPLAVVGMNSIAMYVLVHTVAEFFGEALHTHFGRAPFLAAGEPLEPLLHGGAVLGILWLVLWWMHRRKLYLRL